MTANAAASARCRLILASCMAAGLATTGCRRDFSTPDDALRTQVLDLERENDRLRDRTAELEAELAAAAASPGEVSPEILAATPRVARIGISRLSHASDENGDGSADAITVYIIPKDGRGRFVQMVGTLTINASVLRADADAQTLARITLTPTELRDAYRSGMSGAHYTVNIPIATTPPATGMIDVRATYDDGYTGREHTTHREINLARTPPARRTR